MTRIRFKGIGSPPSQPRSWDAPRTRRECARDIVRVNPAGDDDYDGGSADRSRPEATVSTEAGEIGKGFRLSPRANEPAQGFVNRRSLGFASP